MKTAIALATLVMAVSSAQLSAQAHKAPVSRAGVATTSSLPAFTFKQAIAGTAMDPTAVGKCSQSDDGIPGKLECRGNDGNVAGISLVLAPSYYFYNGRLTSMLFLYDNDGAQYLTLLEAFTTKYGKPCHSGAEEWQSKAGANFQNQTATWCFKTGKLKLESMGPRRDDGLVTYEDDVQGPSKATPQNF